MKKENLRRVSYSLEPRNKGFVPGEEDKPVENYNGYFHVWAEEPRKSPYNDSYYNESVAIVETEDGTLITLPYNQINFLD